MMKIKKNIIFFCIFYLVLYTALFLIYNVKLINFSDFLSVAGIFLVSVAGSSLVSLFFEYMHRPKK